MKKTILKFCAAAVVVLGFAAMRELVPASISGKITPLDVADAVWAIQAADTAKTTVSAEGTFQLEVKPGTYTLVVSAKAPYKNAEIKNVIATEDKNTDAGEIKLEK